MENELDMTCGDWSQDIPPELLARAVAFYKQESFMARDTLYKALGVDRVTGDRLNAFLRDAGAINSMQGSSFRCANCFFLVDRAYIDDLTGGRDESQTFKPLTFEEAVEAAKKLPDNFSNEELAKALGLGERNAHHIRYFLGRTEKFPTTEAWMDIEDEETQRCPTCGVVSRVYRD